MKFGFIELAFVQYMYLNIFLKMKNVYDGEMLMWSLVLLL